MPVQNQLQEENHLKQGPTGTPNALHSGSNPTPTHPSYRRFATDICLPECARRCTNQGNWSRDRANLYAGGQLGERYLLIHCKLVREFRIPTRGNVVSHILNYNRTTAADETLTLSMTLFILSLCFLSAAKYSSLLIGS